MPLGTVVRDRETGELLSELTSENHSYILARGGAGGRGNHYYLSNETRAPAVAETGGQGETKELFIEMKIAAHVGKLYNCSLSSNQIHQHAAALCFNKNTD